MKKEKALAVKKLEAAFKKLKDGVSKAKEELQKDGVIQRFEFTFELMWKALKIFLEEEGVLEKTPRGSLKAAFKAGWIEDEEGFLNMLEDRNKTSHIYSKEESEKIFLCIKDDHLNNIEKLVKKLKALKS